MQCEEIRNQFADYVNGNLEEDGRLRIERHLLECEACRSEADDLREIWTHLGAIPSLPPGSELRARFEGMLEVFEQGLDHVPSRNWWQRTNSWLAGWWPRQPALQLGLALALLVLGVLVGKQAQPSVNIPPASEIAGLRGELADMRQMVALSLMKHESASDRLRGVNWSHQLQPGNEVLAALIDTLTHDSNVNVRLATVDALRQFGDQPVVRRGVVDAIAREEFPMVQIELIDFAVDLRAKEAVGALRLLADDQKLDGAVRERAGRGLAKLE